MNWYEATLSLQLEAELSRGARERLVAEVRKAQEDAAYDALRSTIGAAP